MKTILILINIILLSFSAFTQDGLVKEYYENSKLKSEITFNNGVREGEAKFYWENGNLKEIRNYVNGRVEGVVTLYWENGKMKKLYNLELGKREGPTSLFDSSGTYIADLFFEGGKLEGQDYLLVGEVKIDSSRLISQNTQQTQKRQQKKNNNSDFSLPPTLEEETFEDDPAYYLSVEVMPEPIGGMDAIYKKLVYPKEARDEGIEGTIIIRALIEKDGEVSSAEVIEGLGYGVDEIARLAVYYSRFKPGLQRGEKVKVQLDLPIEFKLNNKLIQ